MPKRAVLAMDPQRLRVDLGRDEVREHLVAAAQRRAGRRHELRRAGVAAEPVPEVGVDGRALVHGDEVAVDQGRYLAHRVARRSLRRMGFGLTVRVGHPELLEHPHVAKRSERAVPDENELVLGRVRRHARDREQSGRIGSC